MNIQIEKLLNLIFISTFHIFKSFLTCSHCHQSIWQSGHLLFRHFHPSASTLFFWHAFSSISFSVMTFVIHHLPIFFAVLNFSLPSPCSATFWSQGLLMRQGNNSALLIYTQKMVVLCPTVFLLDLIFPVDCCIFVDACRKIIQKGVSAWKSFCKNGKIPCPHLLLCINALSVLLY